MSPHPLRNRILVKQDQPIDKIGSLHVPEGSEVWGSIATVLEVGPQDHTVEFKAGDRVLFSRQPASALVPDRRESMFASVPDEWKDLLMLKVENIHLVVTREEESGVFAADEQLELPGTR